MTLPVAAGAVQGVMRGESCVCQTALASLGCLRSGPGTPGRTSSMERTASEASAAPLRKHARSVPARAGCTRAKRGWMPIPGCAAACCHTCGVSMHPASAAATMSTPRLRQPAGTRKLLRRQLQRRARAASRSAARRAAPSGGCRPSVAAHPHRLPRRRCAHQQSSPFQGPACHALAHVPGSVE